MNGQRSLSPRQVGPSSLDALSRTIEGLEARIEGLMNGLPKSERLPERFSAPSPVQTALPRMERPDPLAEIRERQRALEAARPRSSVIARERPFPSDAFVAPPRPVVEKAAKTSAVSEKPAVTAAPLAFEQALSSLRADLRQDLHHDISERLASDIATLRTDIAEIRKLAQDSQNASAWREDFSRMAESIERLGQAPTVETEGLRADFEELRSLMDGLVRSDSVRAMEDRWTALEARLETIDPERIQQDLLSLAYRLDDIKQQLGNIGDVRSMRLLEGKLITIAKALEHIGTHLEPNSQAMLEQFSQVDRRLDEISRAVAAAGRNPAGSTDPRLLERLEDRIDTIARHLEVISEQTAGINREGELLERMEALSERIEELANQQAARRLEERLDALTAMLERPQTESFQPELTGYLSDISRKIDALDHGALSDKLLSQIAVIGRRIDGIESLPSAPAVDQELLRSLDDRLYAIAARLDETVASPQADQSAIAGLEQQIAHLSTLISTSPLSDGVYGEQIEGRMAALEDYLATSDEYIVEAARQAAEAVMDNYTRQNPASPTGSAPDQTAEMLAALTEHLRNLEDMSRNGEERSHRTVEALHQTMVQIAEKLDQMDAVKEASPVREAHREIEAAFQPSVDSGTQLMRTDMHDALTVAETASRPSLLAGLGQRLKSRSKKQELQASVSVPPMPEQPAQEQEPQGRQVVDTVPSIDPADALLPEEANELLEPGSGKPDVRKILEKVRARQDAGAVRSDPKTDMPSKVDDRMDFIAAARRAAQAAVNETDRGFRVKKPTMADEVTGASAFARYRRPVLMAVGALLLAAMALSLVKGFSGNNTPEPAAPLNAPAATNAPVSALPAPSAVQTAGAKPLLQSAAPVAEVARGPDMAAPLGTATLSAKPVDGTQQPAALTPASSSAVQPTNLQASAPAMEPVAVKQSFDVPAEITPASLVNAARSGDAAALFEIGSRYVEGRGVPADFAKAAVWFQRAADQGLVPARYRLAGLYEKGTGVPRDVAKAKGLYLLAAAAGNAGAMHNLAVMYASGTDGKTDMQEAAKWFIKAANLGVTDSQFNLAVLYARGSGVKQDLSESYKWFALAARDGDKDAGEKRDEVAKAMAPDVLERAKASVQQWNATPMDNDANSVNLPDEWVGKGIATGSVDMEKAIRNIQAILNKNGFDAGQPDGKLGARTVSAIKSFQVSVGQEPTGKVSNELVRALLAKNA